MQIEATRQHSGAWEMSTSIGSTGFRRVFYGYSKRRATELFRGFVRAEAGLPPRQKHLTVCQPSPTDAGDNSHHVDIVRGHWSPQTIHRRKTFSHPADAWAEYYRLQRTGRYKFA